MTDRENPLADERPLESGEDFPTLDTWIVYFSGTLLPSEAERIRERLQHDPAAREFAAELSAQFTHLPVPARADTTGEVTTPARTRTRTLRRSLLVAAGVLVALPIVIFALSKTGPTHAVSESFARATQLSVIGGLGAKLRSGGSSNARSRVVLRPNAEATLSAAVPSDAFTWFLLCDLSSNGLRTLHEGPILVESGRIAAARFKAPESITPGRTALVMLVAERPFDASAKARVRRIVTEFETVAEFTVALRDALGCVIEARELVLDAKKKVGVTDRSRLRDEIRGIEKSLREDSLQTARASAARLAAKLDLSDRDHAGDAPPSHIADQEYWELLDAWRLDRITAQLETMPRRRAAGFAEAEALRTSTMRAFAMQFATGSKDPDAPQRLRESFRRVARTLGELLGSGHPFALRAMHLEAKVVLQLEGDAERAIEMLESVREGLQRAGDSGHPRYGSVLNDLAGACRVRGRLHRARQYAASALRVYEAADAEPRAVFEVLRSLSDIHRNLGHDELAREYAGAAADVLAAVKSKGRRSQMHDALIHLHLTRAAIESSAGALDRAGLELDSAAAAAARYGNTARAATVLARRVELALLSGEPAEAKRLFGQFHKLDRQHLDPVFSAIEAFLEGRIAVALGEWTTARSHLERALKSAENQIEVAKDLRDRAAMAARLEIDSIANLLSTTCLALDDPAAAFEVLERACTHSLLELFAGSDDSTEEMKQVAELRRQKVGLHGRIEALRVARHASDDPSGSDSELADAERCLTGLLQSEWLAERRAASALRKRIPEADPVRASDLVHVLEPTESLWFYSQTDDALRLFWWPTVENSAELRALRVLELVRGKTAVKAFNAKLRTVLESLTKSSPDPGVGAHRLRELRAILVPDEVRRASISASSIILVPTGGLAQLPFESLVTTEAVSWNACGFLVDELPPITYVRSVSTLRALRRLDTRASQKSGRRALLVGAPNLPRVDRLAIESEAFTRDAKSNRRRTDAPILEPLPETAKEVELIRSILHGRRASSWRAELLIGAAATPDGVLRDARGATIVHLASHGRIGDPWRPYSAGVQLSPNPAAGFAAGFLDLSALLRSWPRDPPARLVVLSACESGRGAAGAYARFSLPSALHRAGVTSVVASLWKVDSAATVQLMVAFYEALRSSEELDFAAALRRAKQELRRKVGDPNVWGAFLHFGAPRRR